MSCSHTALSWCSEKENLGLLCFFPKKKKNYFKIMCTRKGRQSVIREEDLGFFYLGVKVLYASRCFLRLELVS